MNRLAKTLLLPAILACPCMAGAETVIPVYDYVTFYDGYADVPDNAPDEGCLILKSYLKTVRLTDAQLDAIGRHLTLKVDIHARCDNYDRIGSVNLAFLPKGTESYTVTHNPDADPMRIEIARYITPFMDKNKEPGTVQYSYRLDNLTAMLRDPQVRAQYDIWVEFEVFGVPYAAQNEIAGCAGCVDVFGGSMSLITDDTPGQPCQTNVFAVVTTRDGRPDTGMNNYSAAGTDEIGRTIKTFAFEVPRSVKSGRVVIIMSNHGAAANGEEYKRRDHYARFDGVDALKWKPGRTTCEPYRMYNTQPNGIYGTKSMGKLMWQSFSNWCPGAAIPFQSFETGAVEAGTHSVTIEVPAAQFYGGSGYFPVSIYFQGDTEGAPVKAPVDSDSDTDGVESVIADDYTTDVVIEGGTMHISAPETIDDISLYDIDGRFLLACKGNGTASLGVDISQYPAGVYVVAVAAGDAVEAHKVAW